MMKANPLTTRRDLELEALVEIMNKKKIYYLPQLCAKRNKRPHESVGVSGFPVNTFTHILEGYKVADKMKAHGASASTAGNWWNYKMEVLDAIPYNAYIMQKSRIECNPSNSDDAKCRAP